MKINKLFSRLSVAALLSTVITVGANPAQAGTFTNFTTIDFDEFDVSLDGKDNPRKNGNPSINNLWKDYGLKMNAPKNKLWLYDSTCKATGNDSVAKVSKDGFKIKNECTGGDNDLATGRGKYKKGSEWIEYETVAQDKVLIIQETRVGKDSAPNDRRGSDNIIEFNFTDKNGVDFKDIGLLDFDDPGKPTFTFTFTDGTTQELKFGKEAHENNPMVTLLSTDWNGNSLTGENSLIKYEFDFSEKIRKLEINLAGSGAITELNYLRKVPEPTSILGLAAVSGLAASSLKRKRKSSNT